MSDIILDVLMGSGEDSGKNKNDIFDNYIKDPEDGFFGVPKDSKKKPQTIEDDGDYGDGHDFIELTKEEKVEKVRKLKIGNEKELRNLIDKDLVFSMFGEIGQALRTSFVDMGRREANTLSNLMECPQKERDIEAFLNDKNQEGIEAVISKIEELVNTDHFLVE